MAKAKTDATDTEEAPEAAKSAAKLLPLTEIERRELIRLERACSKQCGPYPTYAEMRRLSDLRARSEATAE